MTSREIIVQTARRCGMLLEDADLLAMRITAMGYVCVPVEPTELMLRNAWADALGEDAAGVWRQMIQACEDPEAARASLGI